jgi:hopanoid-associated phosphorylase
VTILVACGVEREAAVLGTYRQIVIPGGGDAAALREKLERAVRDASGIISFGLGGALDPDLKIGGWVIGTHLVGETDMDCDPDWVAALQRRLPKARLGSVFSDGRLISATVEKAALAAKHSALVVDMESHVAGDVARKHGLPFAILRCVSDEANQAMPPAISVAMLPDGGVNGRAMLASIARQPAQVPSLISSIVGFLRAMRALKRHGPFVSRPISGTNFFSSVSRVEKGMRGGNQGEEGWNFDLTCDDIDYFAHDESVVNSYRRFLEELPAKNPEWSVDLPEWTPSEDCIEGSLIWRGNSVHCYYETLLNFLTFWSADRNTVEELRAEIIRLTSSKL